MLHVKAALTLAIAVWLATIPAQAADEIPGRTASPPGSLSVMFVGDIMLDGGPGHAIASGRDPFAACAALLMNADFTIGNLECVLGRGGKRVLKNYSFRAAKDSPTLLKRYFSGPRGSSRCWQSSTGKASRGSALERRWPRPVAP
jgi:poly-gamma-glutamate synthesis protein (capsule biosynthesis protein)